MSDIVTVTLALDLTTVPGYRCDSCAAVVAEDDAPESPLYECGSCGTRYTRDGSADGSSNRCPDCNKFGAKVADLGCEECGDGALVLCDPPLVTCPVCEDPIDQDDISEHLLTEHLS